jgi:shikimate dehydrogenase
MTDQYAVIGNPITHSKSPLIHAEFAKNTQQDMQYKAIEIELDGFKSGLEQLKAEGFKGINITVPFKEIAWHTISHKSDYAQRAGAINTIVFNNDGSMFGDNTDGIGLCRDLTDNNAVSLTHKRILLLGAGGAARGVIEPLLSYLPTELVIANRTASKAHDLAELFAGFGNISGVGYEALTGRFDVVINATSASLQGTVPPLPDTLLNAGSCCYDMMYSDTDTAFITWAKQHSAAKTIDGLGMLIEQAAEAFRLWRGVKPATQLLIQQLKNEL